jgi:CTP synthase (UTP-ammonia lyase)
LDYKLPLLNLLGGAHVNFFSVLWICELQMYFCDRRNVMNWKDANTTEIDPDTPYPVVIDMPEHNPGQMGGTMRLGKRTTIFHGDSTISKFIRI